MAEGGETPLSFAWNDPFDLDGQLGEDEKLVRDSARAFAQGYLLPRAGEDYLEERFDREIMTRMGGVFGHIEIGNLPERSSPRHPRRGDGDGDGDGDGPNRRGDGPNRRGDGAGP